ncbi:hypothetical protein EE612_047713, partial [Oryza sativa]
KYGGQGS